MTHADCMTETRVLTPYQSAHISKVYPECRADMRHYFETGAQVVVYRQHECGDDVLPFALAVSGTDFWIDCCESPRAALTLASKLGLEVVKVSV
ncbi:hypothetical protein EV147_3924 [Cupriavidus agavae]|uniref:Uncharacterized protein n=1 Tax=Cupriavidus agavae TaxID=1001822 RepID=A0A4Q7RR91_9BURK|nr:hypothetical protein EV147_3924 [Cupriavidus agavae]